jgi:uncharacterized membrane protein YraQ (UPF0718 family)
MDAVIDLIGRVSGDVGTTIVHVWPFLAISIVTAAALKVFVGTDRVAAVLARRVWLATGAAVLLAALTPFCSCGTTAVILGGLAAAAPWAPLVAFMVSSPLTSPSELVFSAGLFGWPFAWFLFVGTIVLGIGAGVVGGVLDKAGWLRGQARMASDGCGESCTVAPAPVSVGPGAAALTELRPTRLRRFGRELVVQGRKLAAFFLAFTAVGYLLIEAIPTEWLTDNLSGSSPAAVPLAALIGLPAYVNTEGSLPLVAALVDGGMGTGPAMAFIVTGAGTSIGAVTGLLVIARKRVVGLVVALLLVGAILLGWAAQLLL